MEAEALTALLADGVPVDRISYSRHLEMRYAGQSYELTVELPSRDVDDETIGEADAAFHRLHAQAYGHAAFDEPTMIVNVRVTGIGDIPKPGLRRAPESAVAPTGSGHRMVHFSEAGGFVETPIYVRRSLQGTASIVGPAVIEEMDSTTVIPPGFVAVVDGQANLRISPAARTIR